MCYVNMTSAGLFNSEILKFGHRTLTDPRPVAEYEIELYEDSRGFVIVNGEKNAFDDYTVMLLRPGDMRQSTLPLRCHYLHFTTEDEKLRASLNSLPSRMIVTDRTRIRSLIEQIASISPETDAGNDLQIAGYLFLLVAALKKANEIIIHPGTGTESIVEAKVYIDKYYQKNLTLSNIASHVGLSPNYLCSLFQSMCGIGPHEYLAQVRLFHAKHLLSTTDKSISDISKACGFHSFSYFTAFCHARLGMTPRDYRKMYREQNGYIL